MLKMNKWIMRINLYEKESKRWISWEMKMILMAIKLIGCNNKIIEIVQMVSIHLIITIKEIRLKLFIL